MVDGEISWREELEEYLRLTEEYPVAVARLEEALNAVMESGGSDEAKLAYEKAAEAEHRIAAHLYELRRRLKDILGP
jgi:division protein CdvB (Snf7/Vps24/ESCRT-III family)